jgi:hypothetical protein
MLPTLDNKKYAGDTRLFRDTLIQDGIFNYIENSPVLDGVKTNEICVYAPGNKNRMGKENKTSWDSFTYAILMGHNVWMHLTSVQEANRQYDAGLCPTMLVQEKFDRIYFRDVVNEIFATSDRGKSYRIIEEFSKFWMAIPGTRGYTGKRTINANTNFTKFFDEVEEPVVSLHEDGEFSDEENDKLEELEIKTEQEDIIE